MNALPRAAIRVHAILLQMYPQRIRAEFGAEMQAVFAEAAAQAADGGRAALLVFMFRELADLPRAALHEQWRARRDGHIESHTGQMLADRAVSRPALLATLSVFVLAGTFAVLANDLPAAGPVGMILYPMSLLTLLMLFAAGLFQGFPRWALPLLGLLITIVAFVTVLPVLRLATSALLPNVMPGDEDARLRWQVSMSGIIWLGFLLTALLAALIIPGGRPLRPLFTRFRRDWTQLSFTLYGAGLFSVALAFDEYGGSEPFQIAGMLFLAAGAWAYLRSPNPQRRRLALLAGAALSMAMVALGKWLIIPVQNWPSWLSWHTPDAARRFEVARTLVEMGWMLIVLAAPALLALPPRSRTGAPGV